MAKKTPLTIQHKRPFPMVRVIGLSFAAAICALVFSAVAPRAPDTKPLHSSPLKKSAEKKPDFAQQPSAPLTIDPQIPAPVSTDTDTDDTTYKNPTNTVVAGLVDGRWVAQGDVLVDPATLIDDVGDAETRIAVLTPIQLWSRASIPYVLDADVDATKLQTAFTEFETRTPARFFERTNEPDYIVIRSTTAERCESYLGRKGGEQELVLGPSCTHGQILHELMHALGFAHEQSREDRDQFITIHWDAIEPAFKNQFQKLPTAVAYSTAEPFDFDSVLLYPSDAFSVNGRRTITKRDGSGFRVHRDHLSPTDCDRVRAIASN